MDLLEEMFCRPIDILSCLGPRATRLGSSAKQCHYDFLCGNTKTKVLSSVIMHTGMGKGPPYPMGKGPPYPMGKGSPYPMGKGSPYPMGKGSPYPMGKGPPYPMGKGSPYPMGKGPSYPMGMISLHKPLLLAPP